MTAINFTNALGVHEQALHLRTQRSAVLANNLANAAVSYTHLTLPTILLV